MVLMSMSLSIRLMSGANFPSNVACLERAWLPNLGPLASQDPNLGWIGFLTFFRRTRNFVITRSRSLPMSAPGKLLVSYEC